MSTHHPKHVGIRLTALLLALLLCLSGCSAGKGTGVRSGKAPETDASDSLRYLRIVNDEPDTADPQCTDGYYDIPLNVFDRLVEVQQKEDGSSSFVPSLAQSWEVSDDGLVYTFHLQEGVHFSNGSPLTASDAEYFLRGDIYQNQLVHGRRVGLSYIALNESIEPLNDVRVRHALQLALDRNAILMNIYSGRGELENGIYPHGLIGFNPELPEIPFDPEQAAELLKEAGYPDGFDLELVVDDEGTYYSRQILELAAFMWGKIGVRASIRTVGTEEYLSLRRSGALACNVSRLSVDYNDPDAIIYVFFGSRENALHRGLGYENENIIGRVNEACSILNEEERLSEYRALERIIVQEECAWIPLFSNEHYFIVSERVKNFRVSWNGWTDTPYRDVVIED